jgi:hypothetical protein
MPKSLISEGIFVICSIGFMDVMAGGRIRICERTSHIHYSKHRASIAIPTRSRAVPVSTAPDNASSSSARTLDNLCKKSCK